MPVRIRQYIKRMRGGSNAHLILADDDCYYVVKFRGNPQQAKFLVNELVCCILLEYLSISTPAWEVLDVTPELPIERGAGNLPCQLGLHFGSRYPVDPAQCSVHDYVPLAVLREVINRREFMGVLAFDKWISKTDNRQAVFFRVRTESWLPPDGAADRSAYEISREALVYVANQIDHGFAFNGHHWQLSDNAEQGLYTRREVYEDVTGFTSFEPWLNRLCNLPANVLDDACKRIPVEWCSADRDALEALLETLYTRRGLVSDLLMQAKCAARDPFPNWSTAGRSGSTRRTS